jgi:hypothetical protein
MPSQVIVDFKKDCINAVAQAYVMEALDYAIETATSRMNTIGKIFQNLQIESIPTLAMLEQLKEGISKLPTCPNGAIPPIGKLAQAAEKISKGPLFVAEEKGK